MFKSKKRVLCSKSVIYSTEVLIDKLEYIFVKFRVIDGEYIVKILIR